MADPKTGEFALIKRFFDARFSAQSEASTAVAIGIGDDCAALSVPPGEWLLSSVDTLNVGVHFPEQAEPQKLARRALAVSVSDLAAMAAQPLGFTLAMSMPAVDEAWLDQFSAGLAAAAEEFGIPLVGGDTTRGPLSVSVQVMGSAQPHRVLRRAGAQPGDAVVVSGTLGDARAALDCLDVASLNAQQSHFLTRYWAPTPRLPLGQALADIASAAIDISDGLGADLGHILDASGVGARLQIDTLPLSAALLASYDRPTAWQYALTGGDDYELCFTVPSQNLSRLQALRDRLSLPLTVIGEIRSQRELHCVLPDGALLPPVGYQHF